MAGNYQNLEQWGAPYRRGSIPKLTPSWTFPDKIICGFKYHGLQAWSEWRNAWKMCLYDERTIVIILSSGCKAFKTSYMIYFLFVLNSWWDLLCNVEYLICFILQKLIKGVETDQSDIYLRLLIISKVVKLYSCFYLPFLFLYTNIMQFWQSQWSWIWDF